MLHNSHVISCHIIPCHVMSCHVMSHRDITCNLTLSYFNLLSYDMCVIMVIYKYSQQFTAKQTCENITMHMTYFSGYARGCRSTSFVQYVSRVQRAPTATRAIAATLSQPSNPDRANDICTTADPSRDWWDSSNCKRSEKNSV